MPIIDAFRHDLIRPPGQMIAAVALLRIRLPETKRTRYFAATLGCWASFH